MFHASQFSNGHAMQYGRLRMNPMSKSEIKAKIKSLKRTKRNYNKEKDKNLALYRQYKKTNPAQAQSYYNAAMSWKQKAAALATTIKGLEKLESGAAFSASRAGKATGVASSSTATTGIASRRAERKETQSRSLLQRLTGQTGSTTATETVAAEVIDSGVIDSGSYWPDASSVSSYEPSAAEVAVEEGLFEEEKPPYVRYALIATGVIAAGAYAYYQYR